MFGYVVVGSIVTLFCFVVCVCFGDFVGVACLVLNIVNAVYCLVVFKFVCWCFGVLYD